MPSTGKVTRFCNIQKTQKRRREPNRKAHYLCRGMISQAILVWKFAKGPSQLCLRRPAGRLYGAGGQAALSGWAGLGARGCSSPPEKQGALPPASVLRFAAPRTSPGGATGLLARCLCTFPPQSTLTFVPGKQLSPPANQRSSCRRA